MPIPPEQIIIDKPPDYLGHIIVRWENGKIHFDVSPDTKAIKKAVGPALKELLMKNLFGGGDK